jgi:hypothetical protein
VIPATTTTAAPPVPAPPALVPALSIAKFEHVGSPRHYVKGPVTTTVGGTVFYEIVVRNTGQVSLSITVADSHCDAGTLGPSGTHLSPPGDVYVLTCSHTMTAADGSPFVNTAIVSAGVLTARASVVANVVTAGGVKGAKKTVIVIKPVKKKAKPARAVVKAANFTG